MNFHYITISREVKSCRFTESVHGEPHELLKVTEGLHQHHGGYDRTWLVDGSQHDIFTGYDAAVERISSEEPHPKKCWLIFGHDDCELIGGTVVIERILQMPVCGRPMTGIIGVAGCNALPKSGTWWDAPNHLCRGVVYHTNPTSPFGMHANVWPHLTAYFGDVKLLDGVLMAVRLDKLQSIGTFQAEGLSGFHFYDASLSLRAHLRGLQNYVAPIPVLHCSPGSVGSNYSQKRVEFLEKFGRHLTDL